MTLKKIIRDYTFKWWEVSILKLSIMLMGMSIGVLYWQYLVNFLFLMIPLAFLGAIYSSVVAFKPIPKRKQLQK